MSYRQAAVAQSVVIDLGPAGSLLSLASVLAVLVGLAIPVVAVAAAYLLSNAWAPVTLDCARSGDAVRCVEAREGHSSRVFESRLEDVHLDHLAGRSPQDCVAFGRTIAFGGHAKDNVVAIRSLGPGERRDLDATPEGGAVGMIMAFGSVSLLLLVVFATALDCVAFAPDARPRHRVSGPHRHLDGALGLLAERRASRPASAERRGPCGARVSEVGVARCRAGSSPTSWATTPRRSRI